MNSPVQRPPAFYEAYPDVTWDLAHERWLGAKGRSDYLISSCWTCDWDELSEIPILAKPERRQVAIILAACQHWYECPGEPEMEFSWFDESFGRPWLRDWMLWRAGNHPLQQEQP